MLVQTLKDRHPLSSSGCPWLMSRGSLSLFYRLVEEVPSQSILVPTHPLYRRISEPGDLGVPLTQALCFITEKTKVP